MRCCLTCRYVHLSNRAVSLEIFSHRPQQRQQDYLNEMTRKYPQDYDLSSYKQ